MILRQCDIDDCGLYIGPLLTDLVEHQKLSHGVTVCLWTVQQGSCTGLLSELATMFPKLRISALDGQHKEVTQ